MNLGKILLVDDDPTAIAALRHAVAELGDLRFALSGRDALRLVHEQPPDLILLDAEMPDMDGIAVCQALKADPRYADIPVIFVTSRDEEAFELAGLQVGAADFIGKPIRPALLLARSRTHLKLKLAADSLRRQSLTDGLTGLANRRRFDEALADEWLRARRRGSPMSLVMIDVDHFKPYNDRCGHPAGDACLQAVAGALAQASRRPGDLLARYGGEEFALLLPDTPAEGALHIASALLQAIDTLALRHPASPVAPVVTVSLGVGTLAARDAGGTSAAAGGTMDEPGLLLRSADQALYAAKQAGRARAWCQDAAAGARPTDSGLRARRRAA